MPKGIKLKTAMKEFIHAPKYAIKTIGWLKSTNLNIEPVIINTVASTMFVEGPAKAVFPIVSLSPRPAIIIAPGEIILNKGAKMEIKVIKAPIVVSRNSAHSPWRCAAIL